MKNKTEKEIKMNYISYQSVFINTMSTAEEKMLTTLNEITKSSWDTVRLIAIYPDRHVFKAISRQVSDKEQKSCFTIQYNDGRIVVKESDKYDLVGDIFEKTEEKVWNMAEELGYEGDECFASTVARASTGFISLLTHIDDDSNHHHILFESIDVDPVVRLATENEKLYLGYFYVCQEERALRLSQKIGEVELLKQRMDEELGNSYFAKVKDEKGKIHFLAINYLDRIEADIMESDDFEGLEYYEEEDDDYRYQREIIQEWMCRYREAAEKGLSFEGSDITTISLITSH